MNRLRTMMLAGLAACATILSACSSGGGGGTTPQPPAAPTGLTATAGDSAVALAWSASSGATSYKVYRSQTAGALSTKTAIATVTSGVAYTDTVVANATTYYYQVTASNADGESAGSAEVSATPSAAATPVAPSGLTATATSGEVTLAWTAVPTATSYTVYRKTSPGVTTADPSFTSGTNGYTDSSVTNGTTYYYRVSATNGNGEGPLSSETSATPNEPLPRIEATVIRWTPPVPTGVPVVQIRVCEDATCSSNVADATVTVNGTAVPWNAGRGAYESSQTIAAGATVNLSVTVPASSSVAQGVYTASGTMYTTAPTVTAPASAATWVAGAENTVTWTAGAPTATTPASLYVVGIQNAAGDFFPTNANNSPSTAAITASSFVVPAGTLPTAGTFAVFVGIGTQGIVDNTTGGIAIAGAATGSGLFLGFCSATVSFDVTAQPPAPPTGLAATPGDGSVSLAWNASTGATGYKIYRATASGGLGSKTQVGTSTTPLFADLSVTNGTTYYYQVVATNGNGDSAGSGEVSATPVAALPPPFIAATAIRWEPPAVTGVPIQQVRICTDSSCSTAVSDATVTMNGTAVPWSASRQQYEGNVMPAASYHVTLAVTIPAGSNVAQGTYTATINTYDTAPAVTSPAASATWSRAVAHDITWSAGGPTATTPPSAYVVGVNDSGGNFYPVKTNNGPTEVSIASTTYTLPAGTLPAAGTYVVWIGIGTAGIVDGGGGVSIPGAAAGSALYTGFVSPYVAINVTD